MPPADWTPQAVAGLAAGVVTIKAAGGRLESSVTPKPKRASKSNSSKSAKRARK